MKSFTIVWTIFKECMKTIDISSCNHQNQIHFCTKIIWDSSNHFFWTFICFKIVNYPLRTSSTTERPYWIYMYYEILKAKVTNASDRKLQIFRKLSLRWKFKNTLLKIEASYLKLKLNKSLVIHFCGR